MWNITCTVIVQNKFEEVVEQIEPVKDVQKFPIVAVSNRDEGQQQQRHTVPHAATMNWRRNDYQSKTD